MSFPEAFTSVVLVYWFVRLLEGVLAEHDRQRRRAAAAFKEIAMFDPCQDRVPLPTLQGLQRYAQRHCPVGHFLTAVLSNDLMEAVGRADEGNRAALADICTYVFNYLPIGCWGSPAKVQAWLTPPAPTGQPDPR